MKYFHWIKVTKGFYEGLSSPNMIFLLCSCLPFCCHSGDYHIQFTHILSNLIFDKLEFRQTQCAKIQFIKIQFDEIQFIEMKFFKMKKSKLDIFSIS